MTGFINQKSCYISILTINMLREPVKTFQVESLHNVKVITISSSQSEVGWLPVKKLSPQITSLLDRISH